MRILLSRLLSDLYDRLSLLRSPRMLNTPNPAARLDVLDCRTVRANPRHRESRHDEETSVDPSSNFGNCLQWCSAPLCCQTKTLQQKRLEETRYCCQQQSSERLVQGWHFLEQPSAIKQQRYLLHLLRAARCPLWTSTFQ